MCKSVVLKPTTSISFYVNFQIWLFSFHNANSQVFTFRAIAICINNFPCFNPLNFPFVFCVWNCRVYYHYLLIDLKSDWRTVAYINCKKNRYCQNENDFIKWEWLNRTKWTGNKKEYWNLRWSKSDQWKF